MNSTKIITISLFLVLLITMLSIYLDNKRNKKIAIEVNVDLSRRYATTYTNAFRRYIHDHPDIPNLPPPFLFDPPKGTVEISFLMPDYLENFEKIMIYDFFGNSWVIDRNKQLIYSAGPDMILGNDDDIYPFNEPMKK